MSHHNPQHSFRLWNILPLHRGIISKVNGDLFYSPNASTHLRYIPSPERKGSYIFHHPNLSVTLFDQPRWWTKAFGWLSFLQKDPDFSLFPFNILQSYNVVPLPSSPPSPPPQPFYEIDQTTSSQWHQLEISLITACNILLSKDLIPVVRPIQPSNFGYLLPQKGSRLADNIANRAREWFAVWIALLVYLSMSLESLASMEAGGIFLAVQTLQEAGFSQVWLDGIFQSLHFNARARCNRVGTIIDPLDDFEDPPPVQFFALWGVPVWIPWTARHANAATASTYLQIIRPPPELLQQAHSHILKSPQSFLFPHPDNISPLDSTISLPPSSHLPQNDEENCQALDTVSQPDWNHFYTPLTNNLDTGNLCGSFTEPLQIAFLFYGFQLPPPDGPVSHINTEWTTCLKILAAKWDDPLPMTANIVDELSKFLRWAISGSASVTDLGATGWDLSLAMDRPVRTIISSHYTPSCGHDDPDPAYKNKLYIVRLLDQSPSTLGVYSLATVLTIERLGLRGCKSVAKILIENGVQILTLSPSINPPSPVFHRPIFIPCRPITYQFSWNDYAAYLTIRTSLLRQPNGRAALLYGGIVGRIAKEILSIDTVLDNVSSSAQDGVYFKEPANNYLHDDAMTANELAIICGAYLCYDTNMLRPAQKSWWPTPYTWNGARDNVHRWTEFNESWFLKRRGEIEQGRAQPLSLTEWKDKLKNINKGSQQIVKNIERLTASVVNVPL